MAFFGITNLGYQNPIGDKIIVDEGASYSQDGGINPRCWSKVSGLPPSQVPQGPLRCTDTCSIYNQPLPYSSDIHYGSQERHKEMVKRVQTPRSPNQLYSMPLTDNQQYGWWISNDKSPESWTQVKRFPQRNSEMTKFVKEMSMTDREFSLF
ncbi:sperm microtubule inner protein 11 [Polymixia lowei]